MLNSKEKQVQISTLIGKGSELAGDFTIQGSARIDGKVNGDVTVTGALIVGSTGSISGNVSAKSVVIGGEILGDVKAPEKTELTATAKVLGDIATGIIVIDENAIIQGKIDMNQTSPDKKAKSRSAKAARTARKSAKAAIAEALKEVEEEANREENAEKEKATVVKTEEKPEQATAPTPAQTTPQA